MQIQSTLKLFILAAFINSLSTASAQADQSQAVVLKFGVYTIVKPTELVRKFRPLTKAIEERMSAELQRPVDVQFKVASSYDQGIQDIVDGSADFSRFGPVSYIEAIRKNSNLSLIAVEGNEGSKVTYGIIAVRADSEIKDVSDLKGKSFAFGNELSTIGRYLSQQHLLQHGVRARDLSNYEYLDRHDAVGTSVASGRFDAGALREATFTELRTGGASLRELAKFPNAPQAWIAREGLETSTQEALKNALLAITDSAALEPLGADNILPGGPEDYAAIKEAMESNDQFFE